jgi:peroxiredoxin
MIVILLLVLAWPTTAMAGVDVGDKPTLSLQTVEGEPVRLTDYRGKIVVVDFWATWCRPCHAAFDFWSEAVRDHEDVVVLAVAVDDASRVRAFTAETPLPFDVLLDDGQSVFKRFSPPSMPTAYILDRDGVVREIHRGFRDAHRDDLIHTLQSLNATAKDE